jgi:hypothetical protein
MKILTLIAATALIATTAAASAHDYSSYRQDRIDARRAEQAYRINHNRHMGELTLLEKWRLKAEQRQIAGMERAAERDGSISRREANRISAMQDRASYDIYRESHDGQKAWWRRLW